MPSHLWKTLRLTALPFACLLAALPAPAAPKTPPVTIINGGGFDLPNPRLDSVPPGSVLPTEAAQYRPHKIYLKFISPDILMKKMGWPSALATNGVMDKSGLPQGVDRMYAIEGDNSLLVFSTVDGFNRVKAMVKILDVVLPQISIKAELVYARVADVDAFKVHLHSVPTSASVEFISGVEAVRLYSLTSKITTKMIDPPVVNTTNDWPVSFSVYQYLSYPSNTTIVPNGGAVTATSQNYLSLPNMLTVWPHINSDGSLTLGVQALWARLPITVGVPALPEAPLVMQTLPSGDTFAIRIALSDEDADSLLPPGMRMPNSAKPITLLIFVTATIVDNNDDDTPKTPTAPIGPITP